MSINHRYFRYFRYFRHERHSVAVGFAVLILLCAAKRRLVFRDFFFKWIRIVEYGYHKNESLIVRFAPQITVGFAVASLFLLEQSRQEYSNNKGVQDILSAQLQSRHDRLNGALMHALDTLRSSEGPKTCTEQNVPPEIKEIDIESIIEPVKELHMVNRDDPLILKGMLVSANAIVHNLRLVDGLESNELSSESASRVIRQLEFFDELILFAKESFINPQSLISVMANVVDVAKAAVRKRRLNQITKAIFLLESAHSQAPYLIASSILSMLSGSIFVLKSQFMSNVTSLALDQIGKRFNTSRTVEQAGIGFGPRTIGANFRLLLILELLDLLNKFVNQRLREQGRQKFVINLQTQLFRALLTQDLEFFERNDLLEMRQLVANTRYTCETLFNLPFDTINSGSTLIASCVLLASKSKQLSVFLAVLLPIRWILKSILSHLQNKFEALMSTKFSVENMRDLWCMLTDPIGLRTMRIFGREPLELAFFSQYLNSKARSESVNIVYEVFNVVDTILDKSVEISSLCYGGYLAGKGYMNISEVASFTGTAIHSFDCARIIYHNFHSVLSNTGELSSAEKMYDLLHAEPTIGIDYPPLDDMPTEAEAACMEWNLSFNEVSFAYPLQPYANVLCDINFFVRCGERVGILGESGCGKSTLVALIARLYDPTKGLIRVCGRDIRNFNPLWLRRNIAIISQSTFLPFRTVKENLAYGMIARGSHIMGCESCPSYSTSDKITERTAVEEQMKCAMRLAHCENLFFDKARFPQQWHTDIGRNGFRLSGGERQRLCIARAILTNSRILILDEATSALDEESQFIVQESIQKLYEASGRRLTIITIAHRLSNFRNVDKLIVIEKGHIKEQGSVQVLSNRQNGIFAKYVDLATLKFHEPEHE